MAELELISIDRDPDQKIIVAKYRKRYLYGVTHPIVMEAKVYYKSIKDVPEAIVVSIDDPNS